MAKIFPQVVKRIVQAAEANIFLAAEAGARARNALSVTLESLRPGHARATGPTSVIMPTSPATVAAHDLTGTSPSSSSPATAATHDASSDFLADPGEDATRLGTLRLDLDRTSGAGAASSDTFNGRADWQNPTNAQGNADGSDATFAGSLTGGRSGELSLSSFPNWTGKDNLTIDSAILRVHLDVAGTVLSNADVRIYYTIAGQAEVNAQNIISDVTGPLDFDLSGSISVLSDLDGFLARITADAALGETWTANVDAVELIATAHEEITP